MKIKHVLFDMDGVLADWVGGVCSLLGKDNHDTRFHWPKGEYEIETALRIPTDQLWNLVNRQGLDWWAHLDPFETNCDLFALFADSTAQLSILTSPGLCEYAPTGKFRWVQKHIPHLVDRLHIAREKHHLARPDTLLIDDCGENCKRFQEAGGNAILFPQPWNEKHQFSKRPMTSVKQQLNWIISQEIK